MRLILCLVSTLLLAVQAAPVVQTTDFISDSGRTRFNGFESIPNDGTFFSGTSSTYVEDGIQVRQINPDNYAGIWVTYGINREGNYQWYPNGGDHGFTRISLSSGADFGAVGFRTATGDNPSAVMYTLYENGSVVLSGSVPFVAGGYLGFAGGGFDQIDVRDNSTFGTLNGLAIDSIETEGLEIGGAKGSNPIQDIPENTSTASLLLFGSLCLCAVIRKERISFRDYFLSRHIFDETWFS